MEQSPTNKTVLRNDASPLPILIDKVTPYKDQFAEVLFKTSIQNPQNKQAAQTYRDRVSHALLEPVDLSPVAKLQVGSQTNLTAPALEHHLQAPRPVVLFEDPLQYKTAHSCSVTQMSAEQLNQIDKQINESQDTAIFMEEARHELLKPLISLVTCLALIAFISTSVYLKSSMDNPQKLTAKPTATTHQPPAPTSKP